MSPGYDPKPDSIVVMAALPAWKARLHVIAALPTTDGLGGTETLEKIRNTVEDGGRYGKSTVAPSAL